MVWGTAVEPTTSEAADRRERAGVAALAFFSTWTVIGLFVDGWAHNVNKPEDFFTPWHAILYSGFGCGVAYFVIREVLERQPLLPKDRLATAGVIGFASGGVGDGIWHTVFGVEEDVEALLSPTHLVLMVSGILIVSTPARLWRTRDAVADRSFVPVVVAVTLTVSVVAFFVQFASTQRIFDPDIWAGGMDDQTRIVGVLSVLVTNAVVLAGSAWLRKTWRTTPFGTHTAVLTGTGLLLSVLDGFEDVALVIPFALGGLTADLLVRAGTSDRVLFAATPAVLWSSWFLTYHLHRGLGTEVEIWTGSIVYAVLTGLGLEFLTRSGNASDAGGATS